MSVEISGLNLETVTLYSAETDDAGLLVTEDLARATEVAKEAKGYVYARRYKFDGDGYTVEDFREETDVPT